MPRRASQASRSQNTEHLDATSRQPSIPLPVAPQPVRAVVRQSVHFQREPNGGTVEIQNVGTDRVLPAKPQPTGLPLPQ
jgi:hypothetical protein